MLLQALVSYYELMEGQKDGTMAKRGFGTERVSYALELDEQGKLIGITPLKEEADKKKPVARKIIVPEHLGRSSGITPNFLCDNSSYVLGIDSKGKPDRTKNCFVAFQELHHSVLDEVDNQEARAVLSFLDHWEVENAFDHPLLQDYLEDFFKGANFIFRLKKAMIHENIEIQKAWLNFRYKGDGGERQHCLVTGEQAEIARLHPVIKGIYHGQAMGNQLVSFNAKAYESYGKKNGFIAPTGEYAAFAYGTALNTLLADARHRFVLGETTVVYWAEAVAAKPIFNMNQLLLLGDPSSGADTDDKSEDEWAVDEIEANLKRIEEGRQVNYEESVFKDDTKIFFVGLSPNAARISVRFFIQDSLGEIAKKMMLHYQHMMIEKRYSTDYDTIPIWKIISETVPTNAKDKNPSPLLAGAVMRAVLSGQDYPSSLYQAILNRIHAEHDVTHVKAAVIKACLTRRSQKAHKKETITMSLNKESNNKAYLTGRLFAILEKAQREANPGLKLTIAEKYLSSAGSTPEKIFPYLLNLSNNHIAKLDYGIKFKLQISEILDKFEPGKVFPKNFTSEEQGNFYLGYYHQNNENYKKRGAEAAAHE